MKMEIKHCSGFVVAPYLLALTILLFVFACFVAAQASETNIFKTVVWHGDDMLDSGYMRAWHYHRFSGVPIPEELATNHRDGAKWGFPVGELQLGVRVLQDELTLGESVTVSIVLRNVGDEPKNINWGRHPESPFEFKLTNGTNVYVWTNRGEEVHRKDISSAGHADMTDYPIPAQQQAITLIQLDRLFDLEKEGEYSIQVQHREKLLTGGGTTNVVSGVATFKIVAKLSPSEIESRNRVSNELQALTRKVTELMTAARPKSEHSSNEWKWREQTNDVVK
jgi:hypothetical protein